MAGFRAKSPGYSIYNQRNVRHKILPPISIKSKVFYHSRDKKEIIVEKIEEDDGSRGGSGNVSEIWIGGGSGI